jgi:S1 RNA binding domain protein
MELAVGTVLDGKVTGITKFGAFVALPGGRSGLVHISEIAHSYVSDVSEHLHEGQEVRVKVIGIDENGRINLSVKKASEPPRGTAAERPRERRPEKPEPSFEDKLKQFMQESDSRMSDARRYTEKKGTRRGNRRNNYD